MGSKQVLVVTAAALLGAAVGSAATVVALRPAPRPRQTAPASDPEGAEAHPVDLAFGQLLQGRFADGLVVLDDALDSGAVGARRDEALFWKARCLRDLGRPDEAVAVLRELTASHPGSRYADDALFQMGEILERDLHQFEQALACYQTIEQSHPASELNAAAKLREGNIRFSAQNDIGAAEQAWTKAQEYGGQQAYGYGAQQQQTASGGAGAATQEEQQAAAGRNYEAREALERIRFIRDNAPAGREALELYAKAEHELQRERLADAIALLIELVDRFGDHPLADDAQFQIAEAYRRSGMIEEARLAHRKLVDAHPESPFRDQSLARLEQLAELHSQQRVMRQQELRSR